MATHHITNYVIHNTYIVLVVRTSSGTLQQSQSAPNISLFILNRVWECLTVDKTMENMHERMVAVLDLKLFFHYFLR